MDENPQPNTEEVTSGAETAQPEPSTPAAEETANTPEHTESQPEPSQDENSQWLQSKGIDLTTEEGRAKLAKSYRELEKSFHEKSKKASELEKSMVGGFDTAVEQNVQQGTLQADDPRIVVRKLEIKQNVRDFFDANPEAKSYEQKMVDIVQARPHLANDLDALYAVAVKEDSSREAALKSEGSREALETLATKQRAAAPAGAAVNPVGGGPEKITPENVDSLVAKNGPDWYKAHRAEILRASGMSTIM